MQGISFAKTSSLLFICANFRSIILGIGPTDKMTYPCHSCHENFPDYHSLAVHISSAKRGHSKGKRWASKYLLVNGLSASAKIEHKQRIALTEQDKDNKQDAKRELSGETKYGNVFCPKCKRLYPRVVEVEYTDSPYALRQNGALVITCERCGAR